MNKKLTQLVPLIYVAAFLIFAFGVFFLISTPIGELNKNKSNIASLENEKKHLEEELNKSEIAKEQELKKLQSIKPVFQTNIQGKANENLSMFGNMFEDIVNRAQYNGLAIRSIEYDMSPSSDPIIAEKIEKYNACELKFFFVGTYAQLLAFMAEINEKFEYLAFISKLNVTAFSANTDYLLIKMSINLYSRNAEELDVTTTINDDLSAPKGKKSKSKNK